MLKHLERVESVYSEEQHQDVMRQEGEMVRGDPTAKGTIKVTKPVTDKTQRPGNEQDVPTSKDDS